MPSDPFLRVYRIARGVSSTLQRNMPYTSPRFPGFRVPLSLPFAFSLGVLAKPTWRGLGKSLGRGFVREGFCCHLAERLIGTGRCWDAVQAWRR
jgi:hypothetical protein